MNRSPRFDWVHPCFQDDPSAARLVKAVFEGCAKKEDDVCGIAGVLQLDGRPTHARFVRDMIAMVRHRGPDALGVWTQHAVALGHARLSIIDPVGGDQPMHNGDESLVITFNGEIYNYVELRESLIHRGHRFRTESDTEVILHAYEEFGEECVQHFNGQWAFAIWDARRKQLFLSRDRFGIRPLYYTQVDCNLLFASEVKSLFADPTVPRELNPQGLQQLFTFWTPLAPVTVFRGVAELPPAHNLTIADGVLRISRYWQLRCDDVQAEHSSSDLAEPLLELLTDATRLRLRADVPVGAYLSGGLDSSVTVSLAKRMTQGPLRTFSVTFDDGEFDESRYQRQLAEDLEVDHQAIRCRDADIGRVFPEVVWHAEKPMLRTAPAPLFLLSERVAAENFKVVLTGEGADEILGGYDIFKEAKVRRFLARQPDSSWRSALFQHLYPYLPGLQSQSNALRSAFFQAGSNMLADPFFSHRPRWSMTSQILRLCSPDFAAAFGNTDAVQHLRETLPADYDAWHDFGRAQYLEATVLMPGYILSSQGDRMAMAHSVEGRFPFLDHRLAEFAARIPPRLKMKGLTEKHLLKRATRHLVPREITRRTKQPYRAPDAQSFFRSETGEARYDYIDELLAPSRVRQDGVFRSDAVQRLVDKAKQGRAVGTRDNMALIGVLSTQLLIDRLIRKSPAVPASGLETESVSVAASLHTPV
jgi:asparagine synthase (glutamine-hydrolysing)